MDPEIRCLLRLALQEHDGKTTPDHAWAHSYVELAKTLTHQGAGRFVNGVLLCVVVGLAGGQTRQGKYAGARSAAHIGMLLRPQPQMQTEKSWA